jgi:hypothetical protein
VSGVEAQGLEFSDEGSGAQGSNRRVVISAKGIRVDCLVPVLRV